MESGDRSGRRTRWDPPDGQVKQEIVHQANGGSDAVVVVAAESVPRVEANVNIDMAVLQCIVCVRPLKPPTFQCKAGHVACSSCLDKIPGKQCQACEHGGGFNHCPAVDAIIRSVKVQCRYGGCRSYFTYHEIDDHQNACGHAPCSCPEPGCGFAGLPPALVGHLTGAHSWPVHRINYGQPLRLRLPATAPPRRLLVGEGDDSVFLLTVNAATVVSLVCVRASAASPRYMCRLCVNGPAATASSKVDSVLVDMEVRSSTEPGAVALEELMFLTVPSKLLLTVGASKEMPLNIRIDKTAV